MGKSKSTTLLPQEYVLCTFTLSLKSGAAPNIGKKFHDRTHNTTDTGGSRLPKILDVF